MAGMNVGIVGVGGIGLAYAAWIAHREHDVAVWSPRGGSAPLLREEPLRATGILDYTGRVGYADSAQALAARSDVIMIAVPLNGHRFAIDELLPHLRSGQLVIVSSMGSLSALYLYERASALGLEIRVASFGTTALTARRKSPSHVEVMTRRNSLGVSCLPRSRSNKAIAVCDALFGGEFTVDATPLVSTLANSNAVSHVPLALFNWTRIERVENWPQYHFMTPQVAGVIAKLDAERRSVAEAYGIKVRSVEQHLAQSFGTATVNLADIAAELHLRRGGPPGPTDVNTRFLSEDVPYGLVFLFALGSVAGVPTPATEAMIATAGLILGQDFFTANDLVRALRLPSETVDGLLKRVSVDLEQSAATSNHGL